VEREPSMPMSSTDCDYDAKVVVTIDDLLSQGGALKILVDRITQVFDAVTPKGQ
jgi:adenine/guanine phosphoribosyltransferase-like PRPP-binding protein